MVFTTREFLVFFILFVAGFFALPHRFRWLAMLGASHLFYAAGELDHVALLIMVTVGAYAAGWALEWCRAPRTRIAVLAVSIAGLLAPLFVFKYFEMFATGFAGLVTQITPADDTPQAVDLDLLLPLGISFFTFQAIGYVIDVYRGDVRAERHPGIFALYVAFFPQLIAGPIERARRLIPQLRARVRLDPEAVAIGGRLMLWGAFKKLVIADHLAPYVNVVYGAPQAHAGLPLLIATVFFAFQLYCDFSGYVDIARGAARIVGIDLMRNFDRPYGATSIGDFWRRWHISLSSWFRDYLYIPLGGGRRPLRIRSRNVAIVFLLSGLWHGAGLTFVVWGGLHGLYLIVSLWTAEWRRRLAEATGLARRPLLHHVWRVAVTFALVCFGWIFFRAGSMADALYIATHLFSGLPAQLADGTTLAKLIDASDSSPEGFWTLVAMIAALFIGHLMPAGAAQAALERASRGLRWTAYYAMATGVMFWSVIDTKSFIYFRF